MLNAKMIFTHICSLKIKAQIYYCGRRKLLKRIFIKNRQYFIYILSFLQNAYPNTTLGGIPRDMCKAATLKSWNISDFKTFSGQGNTNVK